MSNDPIPIARPLLGEEEAAAAREAILSGWVTQGPRVQAFEQAFAGRFGAPDAIAVSSCTTALHLVLHALGIHAGDEVIVPSMSFIATANCVVHAGATPVFAEVEPRYFTLDAADVARRITPCTRALIVVHQVGNPADLAPLQELATRHRLHLIEDAACAIGTEYRGRPIGSHGSIACFSFHPRKIITTGDGGMITCHDHDLAIRLRGLRQHAMSVSDLARHRSSRVSIEVYPEVGFNYRMTDIQGAVGLQQLLRLPHLLARRRELAERYARAIAAMPVLARELGPHAEPPWGRATFQSYCVHLLRPERDREALMQALLDRGIHTRRGIMTSHREAAYCAPDRPTVSLPVSEQASDRTLLLPIFPQLSDGDQDRVIAALAEALAS